MCQLTCTAVGLDGTGKSLDTYVIMDTTFNMLNLKAGTSTDCLGREPSDKPHTEVSRGSVLLKLIHPVRLGRGSEERKRNF